MKTLTTTTKQELVNHILDALIDGRLLDQHVSDLHHELFNTDCYIIGYHQAEEWLKANYGIFAAIEKIREYEQDNFGEVNTDFSSSEKVVNMLVYILGEELLNEFSTISDNWDCILDEELQEEFETELKAF